MRLLPVSAITTVVTAGSSFEKLIKPTLLEKRPVPVKPTPSALPFAVALPMTVETMHSGAPGRARAAQSRPMTRGSTAELVAVADGETVPEAEGEREGEREAEGEAVRVTVALALALGEGLLVLVVVRDAVGVAEGVAEGEGEGLGGTHANATTLPSPPPTLLQAVLINLTPRLRLSL